MIQEAEAEEENAQMAEDGIRQAVAGMQNNGTLSEDLEDGELEDEPGSARAEIKGDLIEDAHESEQKERLTNANVTIDQQENLGMPNAIISGGEIPEFHIVISIWGIRTDFPLVKDETLKNLMMSWYYAGYYTGLYEGQQQSQDNLSK